MVTHQGFTACLHFSQGAPSSLSLHCCCESTHRYTSHCGNAPWLHGDAGEKENLSSQVKGTSAETHPGLLPQTMEIGTTILDLDLRFEHLYIFIWRPSILGSGSCSWLFL